MSDGNYIKVCRSLLNWEWFGKPSTLSVFIFCLLKANWKDGRFEGQVIERGSFVTSVSNIADATGLSIQQTRTALKHLETTGELTIKTTNKYSVVTVNNYGQYQDTNKQITNKQQTNNKQLTNKQQTTNNNRRREEGEEGKERKKGNIKEPFYPNDEKLDQAFRDYVEMRKTIKAPMTDRAITIAMNKLASLAGSDNDLAIRIIDEAIEHNWKSFYPLKGDKNQSINILNEWRDA